MSIKQGLNNNVKKNLGELLKATGENDPNKVNGAENVGKNSNTCGFVPTEFHSGDGYAHK